MNTDQLCFAKKVHEASILSQQIAHQIVSRLQWMAVYPHYIAHLHCGTGYLIELLRTRYSSAHIVGIESSLPLLAYGSTMEHPFYGCCADVLTLPLKDHCMDMIVIQLSNAIEASIAECFRILKPNGLLMLTGWGPDTLRAWKKESIIPQRIDMHLLGDLLIQTGFKDPVMDVDHVTVRYQDLKKLQNELQLTGMTTDNIIPETHVVTYEIIYGHAWAGETYNHITKIPLAQIEKIRNPV